MSHEITFQMQVFILLGYAQIAATLCGFIGVVFVVGDRSIGQLTKHDSSAIFHFMFAGLGTMFISLLTILGLVCLNDNEPQVWQIANGVSALMHLSGGGRLAIETWRHQSGVKLAHFTSSMGVFFGVLCAIAATGVMPKLQSLVFIVATLWALCVTAIAFVSLLTAPRPAAHVET